MKPQKKVTFTRFEEAVFVQCVVVVVVVVVSLLLDLLGLRLETDMV